MRIGTLIIGIIIGVIGSIAIMQFPELTKQAITAIWTVMKEVFTYVKTAIG